jgi:hypothetical protein
MSGGFQNNTLQLGGVLLVIHAQNPSHMNVQNGYPAPAHARGGMKNCG